MSKVEEGGRADYSRYDNIDTDILEAYLRADLFAPESEQLDVDEIFYIVDLLTKRRDDGQIDWEQKTAEAWERFCRDYYPYINSAPDGYDDFDDDFDDDAKRNSRKKVILPKLKKIWRVFGSVAAVLVLFLFAGTVTAFTLGYDLDDAVAFIGKWNDEQFHFEPVYVTTELANVVAEYAGDEINLVPKWLPDGYVFDKIEVSVFPAYNNIVAEFYIETNEIIDKIYINYRFPLSKKEKSTYEKDIVKVEEYEINGMIYYIMEDLGNRIIVWRESGFECSIKGNFSSEEAKKIINSIYGG